MAIGPFFSQRFSSGIHALAYVATKPAGELTTLPELAEWMRTIWPSASETYLSNVVQRMACGRLLRSHRGITGGYSLGRPAAKVTIRDIVEVLEGIDVNRCSVALTDECPVLGRYAIQKKLTQWEENFLQSLATVSMADLAKGIVTTPLKTAADVAGSGALGGALSSRGGGVIAASARKKSVISFFTTSPIWQSISTGLCSGKRSTNSRKRNIGS